MENLQGRQEAVLNEIELLTKINNDRCVLLSGHTIVIVTIHF